MVRHWRSPARRARETRGRTLTPLLVEDRLYWDVMKYWLPELKSVDSAALAAAVAEPPAARTQQQANQIQNRRRRNGD